MVRGGGTGYTGGAVPTRGGIVLSLERMNRILEIDELNLLARVQPNVITGDLQDAVERVGLFYPPDPASLRQSALGGNVAECAGGPRAFKYGTTKRYVLALEAVLPTGEIIHTGSKAVKNVVGYDSDAAARRLRRHARDHHRDHASADSEAASARDAARGVRRRYRTRSMRSRSSSSGASCLPPSSWSMPLRLKALAEHAGRPMATPGTGAVLIVEVDGSPESVGPKFCSLKTPAVRRRRWP